MIRVSLPWIVGVVDAIDELERLNQGPANFSNTLVLWQAKQKLVECYDSIYASFLRASRVKAEALHGALLQKLPSEPIELELTDGECLNFRVLSRDFKTVFVAELSIAPAFVLQNKDAFDVNTLIDKGTSLFPASMTRKAPETEKDAMEAGRALAYELATACGFHTFRVVESVLKRYWDFASGGVGRPSLQTIGTFVQEMKSKDFGDIKVLETLGQLAKLHRNPLIHPEAILDVEEAIAILGLSRSAVKAMLDFLPEPPITTGAPASPAAP